MIKLLFGVLSAKVLSKNSKKKPSFFGKTVEKGPAFFEEKIPFSLLSCPSANRKQEAPGSRAPGIGCSS